MTQAPQTLDAQRVPCVWVVASHRELGNEHGHPQPYTVMDEVGTRTLINRGLQPVCFPRVPAGRLPLMLDRVQGVLLGGSATNVHPSHYAEEPLREGMDFDQAREAVTLPLIRLCIERGVPLIAFCRGSHEFNVALGGSLHQDLQALGGPVVHWEDPQEPLAEQYAERHEVSLAPGGELERLTGCSRFAVSSLHSQGVKRLAPGLVAEAHADDGLVEAFRWHDARQFAWGFQFHPEWGHQQHPRYGKIMEAFVEACWERLRAEAPAQ
ncbi:gamma-glutamyl-gamma-aminobutyrate hydrolase family protein [uncultured Azohydromonas sp.]|jgi:Predicted glutamine amidotransferases|uniref:gamma-glutamyl-gamma-aminobutyrate hydrolase family protein n=1 Tax=uncultured Azohydromonas sp. TaxID=487342 RepID=UPI0026140730|nr:gamma-glutamyl-gamma-aminobutyrate hydrolase family protein [uncultured Azohydromonas sp.]